MPKISRLLFVALYNDGPDRFTWRREQPLVFGQTRKHFTLPRQPKLQYPRKIDDEQLRSDLETHMNVDRRIGEEIPAAKELPPQTSCSPQRSHHGTTPGTVARK